MKASFSPSGDQRGDDDECSSFVNCRVSPPPVGTTKICVVDLLDVWSTSVIVKATRSPLGDSCGSLTRWTFSNSSTVNRRSCGEANAARGGKRSTDGAKK